MFNKLIKEAYKLSKAGYLIGVLYNLGKTIDFKEIKDEDLDKLLEDLKCDMLYLKSVPTNTEIQIYENELKDFKIKTSEETLYVLITHGEIRLMY